MFLSSRIRGKDNVWLAAGVLNYGGVFRAMAERRIKKDSGASVDSFSFGSSSFSCRYVPFVLYRGVVA